MVPLLVYAGVHLSRREASCGSENKTMTEDLKRGYTPGFNVNLENVVVVVVLLLCINVGWPAGHHNMHSSQFAVIKPKSADHKYVPRRRGLLLIFMSDFYIFPGCIKHALPSHMKNCKHSQGSR